MVRIHPDPPRRQRRRGRARRVLRRCGQGGRGCSGRWPPSRGCSSVGRAPALQAGGRRFDPVRLHQRAQGFLTSVACYLERTQEAAGSIPSSATRSYRLRCDSVQLCVSWKCKAESCSCSLTIREGKAHSGLMRSRMRRVELYLARTRETKGAGAGGANTLVTVALGAGSLVVGVGLSDFCLLIPDSRGLTVMGSSD